MKQSKLSQQALYQNIFAFVVLMPVFLDILHVFSQTVGLNASLLSAGLYVLVLLYILIKGRLPLNDMGTLLLALLPFGLSYLFFSDTREYMTSQSMLIVYAFFIPYGVLAIKNIREWDGFFGTLYRYARIAILLSLGMMLFLPYRKYLIYMDFSYAMLPAVCAAYYRFSVYRRSGLKFSIPLLLFLLGLAEMLVFGARAPFFFVILYVAWHEISRRDINNFLRVLWIGAVAGVLTVISLNFNRILLWLAQNEMFADSYIIRSHLTSSLFESESREHIYDVCMQFLRDMGMRVGGFFGDRIDEIIYPHNLFLELLMSWGWIIGSLMIAFLVFKVAVGLSHKDVRHDVTVFVVCCLLFRYLVSGTYLSEGKFWAAFFALLALGSLKKPKENAADLPDAEGEGSV